MAKHKPKSVASKINTGLRSTRKVARNLTHAILGNSPKRAVAAWAIFHGDNPWPIEVQAGPFVDRENMEQFSIIRFPGWSGLEIRQVVITYREPRKASRGK